ncbi:uncharacterized protein si:ch211-106e7.2 isoform X2 [Onychostoma macrolepis]|uniref:uncharacterized protein si:ch211-106e7.2 isoform X2 n=1 Tax=Onychostoma macrolepis TaxID=369639 RepID=UPI0027295128|nr:uncharacterized protein si:ch211-106e7.2 isoform X2 [Onychostoma macrolepis]
MQANSQHSGQLQNLHGQGTTPGNGTSQNFYQLCLPPHTASPSYSGQTATGNYFTCTVQPATSDQILASGVQATKGTNLAQENQLNSNHPLPTGKQDSQIVLWNMPSNCQIFLPVNNINLQGAPNNNGPNMSHCAFNSANSLYLQPQTTSSAVGPNNLQQFKTNDTQSLNDARINVNTSNLHSRQHYANAPTNLPVDSSKKRTSLPSDLNYCPPTENAHHGPSSLFGGYLYQLLFAEKSNNANMQMLSTCAQNRQLNNAAQKAVAVVTPLSPIGTAPVNVLDKSANVKMNASPAQETLHHQPDPLMINANLMNQTGEPIDLTRKRQRPKSAEPRLNDGLCNVVVAKSPVLANESTDQSLRASSPNLKCAVTEQNKSVPAQMQNEPAEKTKKNCTITDKKTIDPDTVPFIEWPLDRLRTLIDVIQQMECGDQKNTHKTDPGKEILKLYWNGDTHKFSEAVKSGIYQSIMEEVYICSPMNEPVVLRQIVNDARSKVIKDFHVLKHDEVPPKMTYTSSWLNLNENVDDIDKECGYSWYYKSFQNVPEHEAQIVACEAPSKLQDATEKPSLITTKQLPSKVENRVPADKPLSNNESLHENVPVSFNGQSPPVTNTNHSPKHNCQVAELTNSQPIITNSLEAMVDLDEQGVPTGKSSLDNQFGTKSVVSPKSTNQSDYTNSPKPIHAVAEQQEVVFSSQLQVGSSQKMFNNDCAVLDKNVRCETMATPSQAPPVHVSEVETDKMDASATKMNVLPHEIARQCFANEMEGCKIIAAFPDKHKAPLLNTPQILDTISTEEPISKQKLVETAKYSASRVLALLSVHYKSSVAEHNQITDEVQQEQISSEKNMYDEIRELSPVPSNAPSPPVIDNVFPKLNEQPPNTVNPLKGMRNLVRTLEKRNVSLKYKKLIEKHGGLIKHKLSSRTSKLGNSFGNRVGAQSPILIDESSSQSDCTIEASPLSPVVEKREFVPLIQVQNESSDMVNSKFDKTLRCESDRKPCQELSVQINDETFVEMDASSSVKLDVLTQEVAKQCFAENKDIAATLRLDDPLCNRAKCPVSADGSSRQIAYASLPKLYPVLIGPSQMRNESDEEMPEIDCVLSDDSVRCDTDPKRSQELPVNMNKEEFVEMDASASIKINVLPHEVAMQCFADQLMEDFAAPPEKMHKACLLNSPTDTVSTKEWINMWWLEGTDGARSPVLTEGSTSQSTCASPPKLDPVIKEPSQVQSKSNEEMPEIDCMLTDESMRCETDLKPSQELPVNMNEEETEKIDGLDSIKINVLPHEMAELWFVGETKDKDLQKATTVHNSTEDQVKVQVQELKSEKEVLLEDVKPKERKYQSSGGEQLESYCCLAKWFQTLEYGNGSLCMCQIKAELREKEIKMEAHGTSLEVQAEKGSPGECERVELDAAALERTDDSEVTDDSEDESPLLHDPAMDKTKIAKDIPSSEEASKAETETSEQKRNESPTECATNMTLMNEIEQDTPAPDLKKTNTYCLALFGSSSEKGNQLKRTKRYKEKSSCEEPPKTLQVAISSHLKVESKSESKKRKCVESEDGDATDRREQIQRASLQNPVSGLRKNGLSSTSIRKLLSQSVNVKSDIHLAEGNKRKRLHKHTTQQMSMNKFIIRGKTVPSKLLHSPENVKKSKYELGNPALMPLDEGPALEFKVLPETFNFEDEAELDCTQADTSRSMQNEMLSPEEKAERMKTSHVPTQGVWSFSPLKKKRTQPIQDTDVSGSCSLFQEFKKKYQEMKDIASKHNLIFSERA